MGNLDGDGHDDEEPVHEVILGYSFAVGKYEITQEEYETIMGSNPSKAKAPRNPVETVSWSDAREFIRRLNAKVGSGIDSTRRNGTGPYRLLSESEWEYVARAGSTTPFSTGRAISSEQANLASNSGKRVILLNDGGAQVVAMNDPISVGSFSANPFGVHDMHGNVWEWVEDCLNKNYVGAPEDGSAWISGDCEKRVLRGGSSADRTRTLRSAHRNWNVLGIRAGNIGFRVARSLTND